jgi:hypothetical protein
MRRRCDRGEVAADERRTAEQALEAMFCFLDRRVWIDLDPWARQRLA